MHFMAYRPDSQGTPADLLPETLGMDNHIPILPTRLLYASGDPRATLEEIKRVVTVLETARGDL